MAQDDPKARPSLLSRLGWMLTLWAASVAALGLVAGILKWLMTLAGMRSG